MRVSQGSYVIIDTNSHSFVYQYQEGFVYKTLSKELSIENIAIAIFVLVNVFEKDLILGITRKKKP